MVSLSLSQATNKIEERIEEKLHPHSAFMIGFIRVIGNPGVLLLWIVIAANFISREWVQREGFSEFFCIFVRVAERGCQPLSGR